MKQIAILLFMIIIFTTSILSQELTQTVRGTIIDADSKLPLISAAVIVADSDPIIGTSTDAEGRFRLENVPIGRITLNISYMGYESKTIPNIIVNSGKEVVLDLSLCESVIEMDQMVVRAFKNKGKAINDMALCSARSISLEETKRYTGGMEDPARVVSSFAGVTSTPDGSSDIIVRGNSPKYMQWRLDGIEISSPYHMDDQNASFGALTALNNNLLATSDFYTGAFPSEFGNSLSCVFDVKLRTGNNEKSETMFGVGLLGTDVTLEGPLKKGYGGSYLVNYRYSTVSLIKKLGLVDVDGLVNYQDATFKVVLPTKKAGTFSIFGLGGMSGFSMDNIEPSNFTTPGETKNAQISKDYDKDAYLANIGFNHIMILNKKSLIKTSLSYSGTGYDDDVYESDIIKILNGQGEFLSDSVFNTKPAFISRQKNAVYRAAVHFSSKLDKRNNIDIGTKYALLVCDSHQQMAMEDEEKLFTVNDVNKNIGTMHNYVSWKNRLNKDITLVSGIHHMIVFLNDKQTFEPRIAVNWKLDNTSTIHAGYGKHSTMESIHNYFTRVELADGRVVEPNKDLDLLKADHYVFGYEKRFTENLMAKVELYNQYLYDLPVENSDTSYYATINEGIDYRYVDLVNKGKGKNYGIELTLERFFDDNYYFLFNASVFNSKYKTLEGIWRNTQYNGNYLVNFLCGKEFRYLGKKKNRTLAINAKVFLGGGKKMVPLLRDAQGNIAVDPASDKYWDYSKAYENSIDDFHQLNVSVSYKINRSNTTHEIFLDLMNVTNNQSRLYEYYDKSKPGKVGYIKQFGFFPNLMYRVYF